ncbi:sugar ABC transporter permease [Streptomyces solisilvae]|uniref:sugar ABC transporter permease n=1 Tax=Streptomyces sp. NA07423 TaxID=3042026 RepID=UPI00081DD0E1|nr:MULTISPECIES: sugar ABC transporter permease [Streptomyces]MCC4314879.1 sugar ABC transporter permease [Streptomyces malaysiensis]MCM3810593.1 sugar ABC transporter permease [Streptomyces sp. DR7-3]UHH23713.1 sugar ABC transporter permease [Streptomyces sp. HNM0561]WHX24085.1 sugar ABC transporter permease [Streptomyces sp. NA07423]SCG10305.1 D-xylose transport system permease protein [Streptomyces sp. MnatMP-M27]
MRGAERFADAFGRRLGGGTIGSVPVVLGLLAIWAVFQILNPHFLSPRNLSNLSVDIVGTGMLALGVIFVLLVGEIDLSVGSVSGLASALYAVLNVNLGMAEPPAIVLGVLCGTAVGFVHGFFTAVVGVPAFVVTLAGLLGWYGLMLFIMGTYGTINLNDQGLVAQLTNYYFSDVAAAYALAALGTAGYFLTAWRGVKRRRAAGVPTRPPAVIALRTGALAVIAFAAAYVLNRFQGLPLALLIFLIFLVVLDYVLRRTTYGRMIFALGGGVEAARRAGINVAWVRTSAFMMSSTMAAIGGLFLASRINSVSQTSVTTDLLMNAIAAAVIGGTSLFGGRGSTWSALLGVLVIQSIASGVALMDIQTAVQFMITGGVLLLAVVIDSLSRRAQRAHGRA